MPVYILLHAPWYGIADIIAMTVWSFKFQQLHAHRKQKYNAGKQLNVS